MSTDSEAADIQRGAPDHSAALIGRGFAWLAMAHDLDERAMADFILFDKADREGVTRRAVNNRGRHRRVYADLLVRDDSGNFSVWHPAATPLTSAVG